MVYWACMYVCICMYIAVAFNFRWCVDSIVSSYHRKTLVNSYAVDIFYVPSRTTDFSFALLFYSFCLDLEAIAKIHENGENKNNIFYIEIPIFSLCIKPFIFYLIDYHKHCGCTRA